MVVVAAAAAAGLLGSQRRNDLARREHISRLSCFVWLFSIYKDP